MVLSEVFYSFVITSFIGCILSIVAACYKSKCSEIGICGCVNIKRNVEMEEKTDLEMIKNKNNVEVKDNN